MARRSVFVAIAALGAVLFPVSAFAATISRDERAVCESGHALVGSRGSP